MAAYKPIGVIDTKIAELPSGSALVLSGALNDASPVSMAFSDGMDIGGAAASVITLSNIPYNSTLTNFASAEAGIRRTIVFTVSDLEQLTIVSGSNLIMPGRADLIAKMGDEAEFMSLGGGIWRCIRFTLCHASGVRFETGAATPVIRGPMAGVQNISETTTGYSIALKFPVSGYSSVKTLRIRGFEHAEGFGAWEVLVAGRYNGTTGWLVTSADLICGNPPFNTVRFSADSTNNYILLGDTTMTSHYLMAAVMDMTTSWQASGEDGWNDGYSFTLLSAASEAEHTIGPAHYLRRINAVTNTINFGTTGGVGWGEPKVVTVSAPWVKADTLLSVISIEAVAPNDQEEVEGQALSASIVGPIVPGVSFTLTLSSRLNEGFGSFNVTVQGINP